MSDGPIGKILAGKYAIKRRIGRGGMGAVYEGEHVEIGKRVAIKVIDAARAASPENVARFRQEARAAGRIESDHIIHVIDVGEDAELGVYIVMELLRGEDLGAKLERVGALSVEAAAEIAYQAARGLARAHKAGVVHRDLKPANVFLSSRDDEHRVTVKIVDFGLSKLLDPRDREAITRAGVAMGTPQYMSPEQVTGGVVDRRTDVWALGALLYEMLAGRPAFALKPTYEQTFISIALEEPPRLLDVAPHVPSAIAHLVARALVRDPAGRIGDCTEFADRLVRALPKAFPEEQRARDDDAQERRPTSRPPPAPAASSSTNDSTGAAPIDLSRRRRVRLRVLFAVALLVPTLVLIAAIYVITKRPTSSREDGAPSSRVASSTAPLPTTTTTATPVESAMATHEAATATESATIVGVAPPARLPIASAAPRATSTGASPPATTGKNQFGGTGVSEKY